ncbi:flagellar hook protein FliD [Pseudomonas protegens]|uniref:flagellar filament capping protein FliD n=1 Tax=Pseudomonas TaxID=286 RepID=UPI000806F879|nr:flagellar filament capping protein FliD [Pseudomonas protegens]OBZ25949.1 flagellar hook protein FliD [Pseudomonas protegens]OBZ28839.1 flagellar hook protein FliD [Pseudomonas protegens]OKK39250.1 flagellar hook protein FliD [Pseudomonas protegens]OKK48024.1 flagellar hook protein FliD [Pseudomonas protegens]OKK53974.1 flagellar hook protein FliD [Pseudomonas protegens]
MASPILPGTGLGSGLDTGSIVKALVNADKAAKQGQIDRGTTANTASISAIGSLKSLLATFQSTMKTLADPEQPQFTGFSATTSDPKTLAVTANNSAVNGVYNIEVTQIATGSKVATSAFSGGSSAVVPAGVLNIAQGTKSYNLDVPAGSTLDSVAKALNSKYQFSGFSANVVTDSFGSRLVVSSSNTGAGSDITLSGIPGLEADGTKLMPKGTVDDPITASSSGVVGGFAQDAKFTVDGMAITSSTNKLDKTVSGLSMVLVAPGKSQVLVAPNNDGLKASIQKFVDAYNAVSTAITSYTKPSLDDDGKPTVAAALTGDAMPRSILAAMRGPLAESGNGDRLTVLSQLGITTDQKTGNLNFNSVKFDQAMNDKKLGGEVQNLFTGDNGLLERMTKAITPYTQTGGILDTRNDALARTKTKLSNDQLALDRRVESLTAVLTKKYNDMDTLVGKLKATASNITSMFEAMNAQQKG